MPKSAVPRYLGPPSVPQEIQDLRKSSLDFHRTLGQSVVHKHKWNERDVREGLARHCPFHDEAYEQDRQWDEYCFGTGYLGGFSDGVICWMTIGDTPEEVFTLSEAGALLYERHPGLTAPWFPTLGDGDLLITVELEPNGGEIKELGDRYVLHNVNPVTLRGPRFDNTLHTKPFLVSQESSLDLLPYGHEFYQIPVAFNYGEVPEPVTPPDYDPSDFPTGTIFSSYSQDIRLVGQETGLEETYEQDIRIAVAGTVSSHTVNIRLSGKPGGTHVNL